MRSPAPIALAVAVALTCGTEESPRSTTTGANVEPGIPGAIDSMPERFARAVERNDPDALAALYAEDAVVLGANRERWEGREEIRRRDTRWLEAVPDAGLRYRRERVVVATSRDVAYEFGTVVETGTMPDGTVVEEPGKWLVVWEPEDGRWRIAAHSFSLDVPPTATPPSEERTSRQRRRPSTPTSPISSPRRAE